MAYTTDQVAKMLDVSKDEVYKLINTNKLNAYKDGGQYRIKNDEKLRVLNINRKIVKVKCENPEKCIWNMKKGKDKYYCPFAGCIKNDRTSS